MKVALIHIRYIYKGGLETRLFNYIDYFLKRGDEVHLYTSKVAQDIVPPKGLHLHILNVKIIPKPFRNFFFDKKLKSTLAKVKYDFVLSLERTTRQDHVIAPSTHRGYLRAKRKFFTGPSDWVQIYLDNKAFHHAKVVYACSQMVKDEIIRFHGLSEDKVKVLHPPTDIARFNTVKSKAAVRKELGFQEDVLYFLFVSTSHKRKGLPLLEKVFEKLDPKKYQLLIAGSNITSKIENVNSLGFVKDLPDYYRAADFTLHPAIYEPFGQIIVESLASGTPVIISDKVGAKELVNPDRGLVLDHLDPTLWREAIATNARESFFTEDASFHLGDLSLQSHMKKMGNWAVILKQ